MNAEKSRRRIRGLREDQDKTQQDIADVLGCGANNYAHIEHGRELIRPAQLDRLADFYGCSADYLLCLTDEAARRPVTGHYDKAATAAAVKKLRKREGCKQKDVAARIQCAQTSYSGYERGDNMINVSILSNIARLYGVSVDFLLGRTAEEAAYPPPEATV